MKERLVGAIVGVVAVDGSGRVEHGGSGLWVRGLRRHDVGEGDAAVGRGHGQVGVVEEGHLQLCAREAGGGDRAAHSVLEAAMVGAGGAGGAGVGVWVGVRRRGVVD